MNKDELVEAFENAGVVVKVGEDYVINKVFLNVIKAKRSANFCMNFPEELKGLSDSLIYKRFMEECEVPIMAKGDLTYFVRTETKESVRKLKVVLKNPEINYKKLVASCRNFYRMTTAMPGFAKFISTNAWEAIYNDRTEEATTERDLKGTL